MKKLILMAAVALSALTAAAQEQVDLGPKVQFSNATLMGEIQKVSNSKVYAPQKKVSTSGGTEAFTRPEGTLYTGYGLDGSGYYNTILTLPPMTEVTFTNTSDYPSQTTWYLGSLNMTEDYPDYIDGYDFLWMNYAGYTYYAPTLTDGNSTYEIGYYASAYPTYMTSWEESTWCAIGAPNFAAIYGAFDYENIAGSGSVTWDDGTCYTCRKVYQDVAAPSAPYYVESISIMGGTISGNIGSLTMYIYDSETSELMATLTADDSTFNTWASAQRGTTTITYGMLEFTQWVDDAIFGKTAQPITIDRAVTVVIPGFESSSVDWCCAGYVIQDCDPDLNVMYMEGDTNGESDDYAYGTIYSTALALALNFNSIQDMIYVADELSWSSTGYSYDMYNVLKISDDGQTCQTYGIEGTDYDMEALYCMTAFPMIDDDGNENYGLLETPDWITGLIYDDSYYEDYYVNYLWSTAEALPSGTTGRAAKVYLQGRGYTAETPVYILQGDATIADAEEYDSIEAIQISEKKATSNTIYNLAGQQVTTSYKGLIIKNGKKVLVK